jgi:hypothetical protein
MYGWPKPSQLNSPTACDDVLPALRELYSQQPAAPSKSPDTLARLLHLLRYVPRRPSTFEVEVAIEALRVEGEVLG